MKTEKYTLSTPTDEVVYAPNSGTTIQDFAYTYDALGNIMNISDQTPNGGVGGTTGLNKVFDYDALYRILEATGPENQPHSPNPYYNRQRSNTAADTSNYTQYYSYDQMGNILQFKHYNTDTGTGNFARSFNGGTTYGSTNKLTSITIGSDTYGFTNDLCGNQTAQTIDRNMLWDYADRMYAFYIQTDTAEPSQYAQYSYDASGHRVMKVVRKGGGSFEVRIYIGSIFEEYYEYDAGGTFLGYQDEIMVMDNQSKVASNVIGTSYPHDIMGVKYVFPDHLGSSNVQLDGSGGLINREEYYPFGETSFGSYGKKRYRYCGKERDEESGMYYYGARYYLPWTCRFVSVDPLADKFPNLTSYQYSSNRPINFIDLDGKEWAVPKTPAGTSTSVNITSPLSQYPAGYGAKMVAEYAQQKKAQNAQNQSYKDAAISSTGLAAKSSTSVDHKGVVNDQVVPTKSEVDKINAAKSTQTYIQDAGHIDWSKPSLSGSSENNITTGGIMMTGGALSVAGGIGLATSTAFATVAAAPVVAGALVIVGLYGITAGAIKTWADLAGHHDDASKIPETYTGGVARGIDVATKDSNHTAENIGNLLESAGTIAIDPPKSITKFEDLVKIGGGGYSIVTGAKKVQESVDKDRTNASSAKSGNNSSVSSDPKTNLNVQPQH